MATAICKTQDVYASSDVPGGAVILTQVVFFGLDVPGGSISTGFATQVSALDTTNVISANIANGIVAAAQANGLTITKGTGTAPAWSRL